MSKSSKRKWESLTIEQRKEIGNKISQSLLGKVKTGNAAKGHKKPKERNEKASITLREKSEYMSSIRKGLLWWNNGINNKKSKEHPGEGWFRGKLPHNKSYNSNIMKEIWIKRKSGELPMSEYSKNKETV